MHPHSRPSRVPARPSYRRSCIALLLATQLTAQAPPAWRELVVPGGIGPGTVTAQEMLVACRAPTTLHVFSAATANWHALPISAGTTPQYRAQLALVAESDRWTAFSAWRGVFVPLFVPMAQTTLQASDSIACVRDANTLHTFSAFTGLWHSRSVPTGWVLETGPRLALLRTPGSTPNGAASAFDAFTGTWHDLAPQSTGLVDVRIAGCSTVVSTATQQFGFSALRPGWVQSPVIGTAPFPLMAQWHADGDLVPGLGAIFSGLTGTFAPFPFPASTGLFVVAGNVAAAATGTQSFVLGACSNTWIPLAVQGAPLPGPNAALGYSGGNVVAFSPLLDAAAAHAGVTGTIRGNVVTVENAAFSTRTGQWSAAPAGVSPVVRTTNNTATWSSAAGLFGWSALDGSTVAQAGSITPAASGLAGYDATSWHAFDALGHRWHSAPRAPSTVFLAESPHVVVGISWLGAFFHSTRTRRPATVLLPEPWAAAQANGLVGHIVMGTRILACSGMTDTMAWQGDVDDRYAAGRGTTVRLQARVPANHFVAMAFGPHGPAPVATPFGDAWLDPATAVVVVMPAAPGESRAVLPVAIPDVPALRNTLWLQQAITLAPNGAMWLGAPSVLHVQ